MRQHRQKESCHDCHARLDPWGIPFERYNAVGRYEPYAPPEGARIARFDKAKHGDLAGYSKYLQQTKTIEVDAAARLPAGIEVDGMADLKAHLLKDRRDDIAENVLRRLLSYALGRELSYRDRYTVEDLLQRAEKNSFRMQDLIVLVCQSDLFTERPKP